MNLLLGKQETANNIQQTGVEHTQHQHLQAQNPVNTLTSTVIGYHADG